MQNGSCITERGPARFAYLLSQIWAREALNVGIVLISAASKGADVAEKVLTKLLSMFPSENQTEISKYYTVELPLDDMRRIQQFIELCLECNYEANAEGKFSKPLEKLFDNGQVYCFGLQPYPAVALSYYMKYSGSSVRSLRLQPVPHPSEPVVHYGPWRNMRHNALKAMKQIPPKTINEICDAYKKTHDLHEEIEKLPPTEFVSYTQCMQSCEGLSPPSETSIKPIIESFEYINLEKLSIDNFKLEENFDELIDSIEDGNMKGLEEIWAPAITTTGEQMTQLAEVVDKMPAIKVLGIQRNKIEPGITLPALVEKLPSCKVLQSLHMDSFYAPADDMKVLAQGLPSFSSQLRTLFINDNEMSDDVATLLTVNLPRALTYLGMSVWRLSRSKHSELLQALIELKGLEKLGLYSSSYPSDLIKCVGKGLLTWRAMKQVALAADGSDKTLGDETRTETSEEISADAWQTMKTSLNSSESKLSGIRLSGIQLKRKHFKELVKIGEQKGYRHIK